MNKISIKNGEFITTETFDNFSLIFLLFASLCFCLLVISLSRRCGDGADATPKL